MSTAATPSSSLSARTSVELPGQPHIKVLIAEDEAHLGTILEHFLVGRGHQVTVVRDGRAALQAMKAESYDVALLDIVMPEMDGLEVLKAVREEPTPPEVIIITGNGTVETAITAMKLGAYDYLSKPYRMAEIDVLVRRAWEKKQLARENALLHTQLARKTSVPEILTRYAPMQAVLSLVEKVARSDSAVLITGESGTGKELIARALHRLSGRSGGELVDVNCAAIAESLLESELFGHEKGAFTGALARKTGMFELSSGGTLFLDEIGELDPRLQGKLLRALETRSFFRVGGTQKVDVNVRIVAATNRDLQQEVTENRFRGDLYFRISTINVHLPPLRDRVVDVPMLAEHFLRTYGGAQPPRLTEDAVRALEGYAWPGNIREMRNVIERAVLLSSDGVISARDLPLTNTRISMPGSGAPPVNTVGTAPASSPAAAPAAAAPVSHGNTSLADLERRHIEAVLRDTNWHQGKAASILGISSKTLYRKIREYGFERPR